MDQFETIKVFFIDNGGKGFAESIDLRKGTTVGQLFARQYGEESARNYVIRRNRQPTAATEVLEDEDRVSISPAKIEGARLVG